MIPTLYIIIIFYIISTNWKNYPYNFIKMHFHHISMRKQGSWDFYDLAKITELAGIPWSFEPNPSILFTTV